LVAELVWDDRRPREISIQAPLLVVPDVLDPEQCAELIAVWEQQGHSQTGVESATGGGRTEQLDAQLKRRRDHVVGDPQRSRELATRIGRRVMPELSKAFAYRASRFEGFKIGCYQASDGGFFRAHRDNLSPATAHRRFALTLNLNDGYQGGQLRFPEYGPELYRPAAGAALVFSCSHLHEVLDVTAGRRLVLLSFLFGEEARRPE
jgi:predicted 2-oxoglutarate/Fe(II)-dependent dioxygenase YbiX